MTKAFKYLLSLVIVIIVVLFIWLIPYGFIVAVSLRPWWYFEIDSGLRFLYLILTSPCVFFGCALGGAMAEDLLWSKNDE